MPGRRRKANRDEDVTAERPFCSLTEIRRFQRLRRRGSHGIDGNGQMAIRGQMVTTLKRAHRTRVVVIALGLFYAGCSIRQPVQIQTVFDGSEHKPYTEPGENSIKDKAFSGSKVAGSSRVPEAKF